MCGRRPHLLCLGKTISRSLDLDETAFVRLSFPDTTFSPKSGGKEKIFSTRRSASLFWANLRKLLTKGLECRQFDGPILLQILYKWMRVLDLQGTVKAAEEVSGKSGHGKKRSFAFFYLYDLNKVLALVLPSNPDCTRLLISLTIVDFFQQPRTSRRFKKFEASRNEIRAHCR
jgi:hypothetical protein